MNIEENPKFFEVEQFMICLMTLISFEIFKNVNEGVMENIFDCHKTKKHIAMFLAKNKNIPGIMK